MNKPRTVGKNVLYPELSYQVMRAVYEVHNQLGPGFTEDVYETALAFEFNVNGIAFEQQKQIQVYYKDHFAGTYRLDMVIEQKIILELKAVTMMNDIFKAQLRSYLCATDFQLGILINFGTERVQSERIIHTKKGNS